MSISVVSRNYFLPVGIWHNSYPVLCTNEEYIESPEQETGCNSGSLTKLSITLLKALSFLGRKM